MEENYPLFIIHSQSGQGLFQIGKQIVNIFNPNRIADEIIFNAQRGAFGGGKGVIRGKGGLHDQCFYAAQTGCILGDFEFVHNIGGDGFCAYRAP